MNKLTPEYITDQITGVHYHIFPDTTITVCCLTLVNGYNVIGKSACADPANFDKALGEKFAYEHAKNQIWEIEGYLLKQRLFEQNNIKEEVTK